MGYKVYIWYVVGVVVVVVWDIWWFWWWDVSYTELDIREDEMDRFEL